MPAATYIRLLLFASLVVVAPAARALPLGTIGGPADSLIRVTGGSHCNPPGVMCVEALTDLPYSNYSLDGVAEIYAQGSIDHSLGEIKGYVDFSTQTGSGSSGELFLHARDQFTLAGPVPGETVSITARFHVDGSLSFLGEATSRGGFVEAKLSSREPLGSSDGWNSTTGGIGVSTGTQGYFNPCGAPGCFARPSESLYTYDIEAVDTFDVVVGTPFELVYALRLNGSTVLNGASSVVHDALSTGTLSFDLAPGYSITSGLGYALPEPATGLLLACGVAGLLAARRPIEVQRA